MEGTLREIAHYVALAIELIAIIVIAVGALQAVIGVARTGLRADEEAVFIQRAVWMRFARWLVAGMTFQLAADVVATSLAPTWDEIGHLASIAVVRTFLSYFLDREMEAKSELQAASRVKPA